jgi:hypothetical protein
LLDPWVFLPDQDLLTELLTLRKTSNLARRILSATAPRPVLGETVPAPGVPSAVGHFGRRQLRRDARAIPGDQPGVAHPAGDASLHREPAGRDTNRMDISRLVGHAEPTPSGIQPVPNSGRMRPGFQMLVTSGSC